MQRLVRLFFCQVAVIRLNRRLHDQAIGESDSLCSSHEDPCCTRDLNSLLILQPSAEVQVLTDKNWTKDEDLESARANVYNQVCPFTDENQTLHVPWTCKLRDRLHSLISKDAESILSPAEYHFEGDLLAGLQVSS